MPPFRSPLLFASRRAFVSRPGNQSVVSQEQLLPPLRHEVLQRAFRFQLFVLLDEIDLLLQRCEGGEIEEEEQ